MDEFINKVKENAVKVKDSAERITNVAVSKTKVAIDKTKYNYTISGIESKIKDILVELGSRIYAEFQDGAEFNEEISNKCEQIDSLKQEINNIKLRIAELENAVICTECGEVISETACFCSKCGKKMKD